MAFKLLSDTGKSRAISVFVRDFAIAIALA